MAVVLDSLVECGYGVAYRVLNAQFFGVAQRRRRVFFVGHSSGQWERAAAVLFERASLCGDSEEEREAGSDIALCVTRNVAKHGDPTSDQLVTTGTLTSHKTGGHRIGAEDARDNMLVAYPLRAGEWSNSYPSCANYVASPIARSAGHHGHSSARGDGRDNLIAHTVRHRRGNVSNFPEYDDLQITAAPLSAGGHPNSNAPGRRKEDDTNLVIAQIQDVAGTRLKKQNGIGIDLDARTSYTVTARDRHGVALSENQRGELRTSDVAPALGQGGGKPGQGFPCAQIDPHGMRNVAGLPAALDVCRICEEGPDSPRYRGLGNAVAVPVISWIFRRIEEQSA